MPHLVAGEILMTITGSRGAHSSRDPSNRILPPIKLNEIVPLNQLTLTHASGLQFL